MAGRGIVVAGGSAGSIEVLAELMGGLPAEFPASIFVVVHFPGLVTSALPRILSRAGPLPAHHREMASPSNRVGLRGPSRLVSSSVDPLFRTAALCDGPQAVGVILSGNLNDGTAGSLRITNQRGGTAIVQDPRAEEIAIADRQMPDGARSTMFCPECHGLLWEVKEAELAHLNSDLRIDSGTEVAAVG